MLKKGLHIFIAFLLIATTTSSVWGQYVVEKEGVEISEQFEKDSEKNEKELEDKFDGLDGYNGNHQEYSPDIFSGFIKAGSSTLVPTSLVNKKLYLFFHQLKVHC